MRSCLFFFALIVLSLPAAALTERCEIDGVRLTIYAPDWTWQRQNVNVLFVAENPSGAARSIQIELTFPPGKEADFKIGNSDSLNIEVGGGETVRGAITDVYANDGVPRQVYAFEFRIRGGDQELRVPYSLRTIRGAAVGSARWALYLPVIVALVWSVVFALVLPRWSAAGAWRSPHAPLFADGEKAHE